jgi:hypothetical protein
MKKGVLTLKKLRKLYLLAKKHESKTATGIDIKNKGFVKVPLYFGKQFIGSVPINNGKKSVFSYVDKKGNFKKVYWNKKFDKWGHISYKVQFYDI